jgi:hypothetical protein
MLRRLWIFLAILMATQALPALTAPAAEGTKLELQFKEGDTFFVETTDNTKQSVDILGMKHDTDSESVTVTRFKVLKADKDETVIERRIESIKNKSVSGLPGAVDKIMDAMKGQTFKMTLNAKGEVTKLEGYEEFMKKLGTDNDATTKLLKSFMSEETLKESAAEIFAFLPDKPVSKGDTWKRSKSVSLGPLGSLKGDSSFTFKGTGKDGEEIAVEQSMAYSPPKEDDGAAGFKISKGEMKSEKSGGTIIFDASKGRPVRTESSMKMKGSLTIDVMGTVTTLNLDMQQTSKSRVSDKSPLD